VARAFPRQRRQTRGAFCNEIQRASGGPYAQPPAWVGARTPPPPPSRSYVPLRANAMQMEPTRRRVGGDYPSSLALEFYFCVATVKQRTRRAIAATVNGRFHEPFLSAITVITSFSGRILSPYADGIISLSFSLCLAAGETCFCRSSSPSSIERQASNRRGCSKLVYRLFSPLSSRFICGERASESSHRKSNSFFQHSSPSSTAEARRKRN